mmetsp:Transcript_27761/g.28913  ORF Transcript_27761/g.28913 Transcript_27761/m.28913 type:complete len:630 (+) Transcript_27761:17-1906(+)
MKKVSLFTRLSLKSTFSSLYRPTLLNSFKFNSLLFNTSKNFCDRRNTFEFNENSNEDKDEYGSRPYRGNKRERSDNDNFYNRNRSDSSYNGSNQDNNYSRNRYNNSEGDYQNRPTPILRSRYQNQHSGGRDNFVKSFANVQPSTNWGQRYDRKEKLCLTMWKKGKYLVEKQQKTMSEMSEEEKSLMFNQENLDKLNVYYQDNQIDDNTSVDNNKVEDFKFKKLLEENLKGLGIEKLSAIQQKVVPLIQQKIDLIGCAETGSGKTLGFLLPIIDDLIHFGPPELNKEVVEESEGKKPIFRKNISYPMALILSPTRELANQIYDECVKITHETGIVSACVYGGSPMEKQVRELREGVDIIVATPGRLKDLLERGLLKLSQVKTVVLDEADRMLDMGFEPQMRSILNDFDLRPKQLRQNVMFSATFEKQIVKIASSFLNDYYFIGNPNQNYTINKNIDHKLLYSQGFDKFESLLEVLNYYQFTQSIIFANKKMDCKMLVEDLQAQGISAGSLHGDMDQRSRDMTTKDFRNGKLKVLIATDVAARGMDFKDINLVVNYDCPGDLDSYVHRIGRTGRKGKTGVAVSFIGKDANVNTLKGIVGIMKSLNYEVPDWVNDITNKQYGRHNNNSRSRR